MRSDLKKLDSFTLETSKNYLNRNFLGNGRVRVKLRMSLCILTVLENYVQCNFPMEKLP